MVLSSGLKDPKRMARSPELIHQLYAATHPHSCQDKFILIDVRRCVLTNTFFVVSVCPVYYVVLRIFIQQLFFKGSKIMKIPFLPSVNVTNF